jgi:hypothetical protein
MAAGELLAEHRIPKLTEREAVALEAQIDREVAVARKRRRRGHAA